MLANLLLITPVFYPLLMFRTSKAGYSRFFGTKTHPTLRVFFAGDFWFIVQTCHRGFHHAGDSASEFWVCRFVDSESQKQKHSPTAELRICCGMWLSILLTRQKTTRFSSKFHCRTCWCYGGWWRGCVSCAGRHVLLHGFGRMGCNLRQKWIDKKSLGKWTSNTVALVLEYVNIDTYLHIYTYIIYNQIHIYIVKIWGVRNRTWLHWKFLANCLLFEVVLLFLGACSEGADIGIMNPPSFFESYKLLTRSVLGTNSKRTRVETYSKRLSRMIHLRFLHILPNKPWVLGGGGPLLPVMPRLTSSTPAISGVSWTLPKKTAAFFGWNGEPAGERCWTMVGLMLDASDKKRSWLSSESWRSKFEPELWKTHAWHPVVWINPSFTTPRILCVPFHP